MPLFLFWGRRRGGTEPLPQLPDWEVEDQDLDYEDAIERGAAILPTARIALIATSYNPGTYLPFLRAWCEGLAPRVAALQVYLFDRGSTDPTLERLQTWAQASPWFSFRHDPGLERKHPTGTYSGQVSRANCLKYARDVACRQLMPDLTHGIIADLTWGSMWPDGLEHAIGQRQPWGAIAANGVYRPDDAWLLRSPQQWRMIDPPLDRVDDVQGELAMRPGQRAFPIRGGWGGLLLCSRQAFRAGAFVPSEGLLGFCQSVHDADMRVLADPTLVVV